MSELQTTNGTEPQEITKENIDAIVTAWAETEAGEIAEPYRKVQIANLKKYWFSGFLAHAKIMEPYNADAAQKIEDMHEEIEQSRNMLTRVDAMFKELEKIELPADASYEILQCTEHLKMVLGQW